MSLKAFQIDTDGNGALAMAFQKAQAFADAERADGTRAVYARAWKQWAAWTAVMRTEALPAQPAAIAAWISELARGGKSISTINVRLAAILHVHRHHGVGLDFEHPAIRAVFGGIKRVCTRPINRAKPITIDVVRGLMATIEGDGMRALRDRALILVGYWGALRRSEIASLGLVGGHSPIEILELGALLHVVGAKGRHQVDQVAIPRRDDALCAVAAIENYVKAAGIASGPLFRPISKSGRLLDRQLDGASINHILSGRLRSAGRFSAHGLRAGFATDAANAGVPERTIQRATRHRSVEVLRTYVRGARGFADAAANHM